VVRGMLPTSNRSPGVAITADPGSVHGICALRSRAERLHRQREESKGEVGYPPLGFALKPVNIFSLRSPILAARFQEWSGHKMTPRFTGKPNFDLSLLCPMYGQKIRPRELRSTCEYCTAARNRSVRTNSVDRAVRGQQGCQGRATDKTKNRPLLRRPWHDLHR
jgi:hypothetical protein